MSINCLSLVPSWGPGRQPGLRPDWKSNWWPFGLQDTQSRALSHTGQGLLPPFL